VILQSKLLAIVNEAMGQQARLRKGGSQATYFCNFCNHYKRKLEVSLDTGQWHCWICHSRGSYLGSLLSKLKSPSILRNQLFELTKDVRYQRKTKTDIVDDQPVLPEDFIPLSVPLKNDVYLGERMQEYRRALDYVKGRVLVDDIYRYNIGFCMEGEYRDCVIIPSYDSDGKLNYFSARCYYPNQSIKYRNAPFKKDIIGFECFINFDEPVNLTEGAFDAMAVRINAVPLFGTMISQRLLHALLVHKTPWVNLILDNDALKEVNKLVEDLQKWSIPFRIVKLPEKDPSVIGFEVMHDIIGRTKPFVFKDHVRNKLLEFL
jgi:hypothetical protein